MTCQISNCDAPVYTTVIGPNGLLEVCEKCRDELVCLWGYRMTATV